MMQRNSPSPVRGLSHISSVQNRAPAQNGTLVRNRDSTKSGMTTVSTQSKNNNNPDPEDFGAPKKPLNGFKMFCATVEAQVIRKCGENRQKRNDEYKALYDAQTELKKREWLEVARAAHDVYVDEMFKWKQSKGFGEYSAAKVNSSKKKEDARTKKRAREFLNMPKAPLSSFLQYGADFRENLRRQNKLPNSIDAQTQVMKDISEAWRALPREEKNRYDEQRKEATRKHKIEMDAWKQTDAGKTYMKELEENQEKKEQQRMEAKVEQAKIIMQAQLEKNAIAEAEAKKREAEAMRNQPTQMQNLDTWLSGIREERGIAGEVPAGPGRKKRSGMSSESFEGGAVASAPMKKKKTSK